MTDSHDVVEKQHARATHSLNDEHSRTRASRPQRRKRRYSVFILAGLAILLLLVAYGVIERRHHLSALKDVAEDEAVPQVQLISPSRGPSTRTLDLPGNIKAWYAAPIYAQVSGYVKAWYKDYGASVKVGELLATIEAPGLDQQYATAKANLAVAVTKYKLAAITAKRWSALAGTHAVAQQEVDVQVANAVAQEAQVEAVQHEEARYEALEKFKNVVAPFDGIVTSRNTDVGSYVNAAGGQASAQGGSSELFNVADLHEMRVFVAVPQDYSAMLKPGLTATISLSQFPGRRFNAKYQTTANAFNPQTRTAVTELLVDNPDHLIWPGAYTDVHFEMGADPNILIVPEQALLFRAAGMQVALVGPDNKVHLQNVKLGLNLGQNVQVVDGLKPDDRLINNPSAGLLEGDIVHPVPGVPGIAPEKRFEVPAAVASGKNLSPQQRAEIEAAKAGESE